MTHERELRAMEVAHERGEIDPQVDVRGSFRVLVDTPGHATFGVWVNGGKSGDLIVRQSERFAFVQMMQQGGFELRET